jgi:hypothetical protein
MSPQEHVMADADPGADDVYIDTRRQLHCVAEILIAGPQYRTAGTFRMSMPVNEPPR